MFINSIFSRKIEINIKKKKKLYSIFSIRFYMYNNMIFNAYCRTSLSIYGT